MATRDKKPQAKKLSTSIDPPKEDEVHEEVLTTNPPQLTNASVEQDSAKKLPAKRKPKPVKKTFKIKIHPKTRVKTIAKKLVQKPGVKKTLIKNGLAKSRMIRKKINLAKEVVDDGPPVLEPMLPLDSVEKNTKKKAVKKQENDTNYCSIMATIDSIIGHRIEPIIEPIIKPIIEPVIEATPKLKRQSRIINPSTMESILETIEDVVKNIQVELKTELEGVCDVKMEPNESKQIKLEEKSDKADHSVIDGLDIDVHNVKNKTVNAENRRHSIEKITITNLTQENKPEIVVQNASLKAKRPSRLRQSLDVKRLTRSDSPARMLRNGKKRKGFHLLEGIDSEYKKRRRLCSDFSGSEVSKYSGYESDSSYSDLASLSGVDNVENVDGTKEFVLKKELLETLENNPPDSNDEKVVSENFSTALRKSLELENRVVENKTTDSNFNLCPQKEEEGKKDVIVYKENVTPSFKVPEKSIILDIMKQTFNDVVMEDQRERERRKTRSSNKKQGEDDMGISTLQFYGTSSGVSKDQNDAQEGKNNEQDDLLTDCDEVFKNLEEENVEENIIDEVDEVAKVDVVDKVIEPKKVNEVDTTDENRQEDECYVERKIVDDNKVEEVDNTNPVKEVEDKINPTDISKECSEEEEVDVMKMDLDMQVDKKEENEISKTEVEVKAVDYVETPERLVIKNQILQALGLQSLKAAEEAKARGIVPKNVGYTGTLKTVIKINKTDKKRSRTIKLGHKKGKVVSREEEVERTIISGKESTIVSWKAPQGTISSDTAGGQRKSHYFNRSNMDGSSEHNSDGDTNTVEEEKLLIVPEKASSFGIHPDRLCKDECSYCFGKFGLFDTPCHIAQMKSFDRQNKILAAEKHLTRDSCLCDACYRHVDRKLNNLYQNPRLKRNMFVAPGPRQNHCHVLGCGAIATNILKRKWLIKMKKAVSQVINIDLDNPGLHSIPVCEHHYSALEHLMVCAMCKRRLARNNIHYLGSESNDLNAVLNEMMIPVKLQDKPVVCKLCRYYASLVLKNEEDRPENSSGFFAEYTTRLLVSHDVEVLKEEMPQTNASLEKDKSDKENFKKSKRSYLKNNNLDPPVLKPQVDLCDKQDELKNRVPLIDSGADSSSDYFAEYNINLNAPDCSSNVDLPFKDSKSTTVSVKRVIKVDSGKDSVEKSKKMKHNSDIAVQKLGSNPSISVRQLFPCEEELPLLGNIEFNNVKEKTPEGWEKCSSTIQYDYETKMLWNELQKPYGNQSSFLRHLVLLEKYFRNGDLVLSSNATHHSINYTESVQNRLRAYDNVPTILPSQSVTILPFSKQQQKSVSGIITSNNKKAIPSKSTAQLPPLPPLYPCISNKPSVPSSTQISSETEIIKTKPQPNISTNNVNLKPNPIAIAAANNSNILNFNSNFISSTPNYNHPTKSSNINNISNPSTGNINPSVVNVINSSDSVLLGNNSVGFVENISVSNVSLSTSDITIASNSNINVNDNVGNATIVKDSTTSVSISTAISGNSSVIYSSTNDTSTNIMKTINNVVNNTTNINGGPLLTSTPVSTPAYSATPSTSNLVPIRPKLPPGLISIQSGAKMSQKSQQSHKIKFPITKNWRPNLIPIDPNKKPERKQGLVQVISGGKPYHITLEDYKKMCAIKRTFDLRQKRLQESQKSALTNSNSILKKISPKKPSVTISKTCSTTKIEAGSSDPEIENSLEKLDKTVEKLEAALIDKTLIIPKIPKSLTVIPQTVTKKTSRPSSPTLLMTPKNKNVDNNS